MVRVNCVLAETAKEVEPALPFEARIAVYDGQAHLGVVGEHGHAWIALDGYGDPLGIYPGRKAATAAVIAKAR